METFTYTSSLGFDSARREQWLSLLHLGEADLATGARLQNFIIGPHLDEIVTRFYDFLFDHKETQAHLERPGLLRRLQKTQAQYLLELGLGFNTEAYFDNRLRVGATHRRVSLSLSLYHAAYAHLQSILFDIVARTSSDPDDRRALTEMIVKITALDMSLAAETYHGSQVEELEQALLRLQNEGQKLRRAAMTDELTGIANRRQILHELELLLEQNEEVSVLMIDLDHFKLINDDHGHLIGDRVLAEAAHRIRNGLRDTDSVGRFGGEEFCVLLPHSSIVTARAIAERIRARLADTPVSVGSVPVPCTLSAGCEISSPGDTVKALLQRADEALYQAKHAGRNRVVVYEKPRT